MAIFRFLQQLAPTRAYAPLPRPSDPVCVIGDVHGCDGLLENLLAQLALHEDAARMRVVLVGDLIDRGPDSAAVLARVRTLTHSPMPFASVICLMGNHERMMLDFLADPVRHGPRWLSHGGDATLRSFGLSPDRPFRPKGLASGLQGAATLMDLRDACRAALPRGLVDWLAGLSLWWQEDCLAICHAGADPAQPMDRQSDKTLLWGHPAYRHTRRSDGLWVAHGHKIVPDARADGGRIAVDTGAYQTGRLSAALLGRDELQTVTSTLSAIL
jgi:serine/threonine protein phosphatase 1